MEKPLKKLIEKARKDKDILAVSLFGSFARGEKNYGDIDVCLFLRGKKPNKVISKKKLEYVSEFGDRFDIQIFQQLPLYIRERVLREGKILLSKNTDLLYDIAIAFIKEYEDYRPIYESYLEAVEHG